MIKKVTVNRKYSKSLVPVRQGIIKGVNSKYYQVPTIAWKSTPSKIAFKVGKNIKVIPIDYDIRGFAWKFKKKSLATSYDWNKFTRQLKDDLWHNMLRTPILINYFGYKLNKTTGELTK